MKRLRALLPDGDIGAYGAAGLIAKPPISYRLTAGPHSFIYQK
jgi:hypothetical protein